MSQETRWQLAYLIFIVCFALIAGGTIYAWLRPAPPIVHFDEIEQQLVETKQQIEETRSELLRKIEEEREVEVRTVYVKAKARIEELGQRPEEVSRGLADLVAQFRAERLRHTQTSTTMR